MSERYIYDERAHDRYKNDPEFHAQVAKAARAVNRTPYGPVKRYVLAVALNAAIPVVDEGEGGAA